MHEGLGARVELTLSYQLDRFPEIPVVTREEIGELGVPLQLLQGNRVTFQIEAGNPGFFWSCSEKLGVSLKLSGGNWRSCGVAISETGLLFEVLGEVGIPLNSKQGHQPSSQDEVGNMGFILSCGKLRVPLELQQVSRRNSRVAKRESRLCSGCRRELGIALKLL